MKSRSTLLATITLSVGFLSATVANATLTPAMGGQVVNDTDLNITWLANANLAATNTFGLATGINLGNDSYGNRSIIFSNGLMSWAGAQKWIAAMNAANYLGFNDWRLPTVTDTGKRGCDDNDANSGSDCGYNVDTKTSEMAHLYFNELGNKSPFDMAGDWQAGGGLVNTGPFTNLQTDIYWSGTGYAWLYYAAWSFDTEYGFQSADMKSSGLFAMAVRPGQVSSVSAVPELDSYVMMLAGLGVLGFMARRRLALR